MSGIGKPRASDACSAAYAYDGREPGWRSRNIVRQYNDSEWHPRLFALANAGYIFLPQSYAPGGVLFRGMSNGLLESLAVASFWHFSSSRPLARLEQELDVIFCSEHAGDALAAAWPWESASADAGLLLFSSSCFTRRYHARMAAILALADPGMVFKYPLMTEPLHWGDVDAILINPSVMQRCQALIYGEPVTEQESMLQAGLQRLAADGLFDKLQVVNAPDRAGWAKAVDQYLQQSGSSPAATMIASDIPRPHVHSNAQ